MSPTRAAAYLGGAVLFAGWFASAAGVTRHARIARALPAPEVAPLDAIASDVQSQASRLRQRMAVAPAPQAPFRNPFAFAERQILPAARPRREPPAPDPEPVLPDEPALDLLGVAEEGTTRTAIIGLGDELLMVTVGQEVAGRYRVAAVGADGVVELKDLATGATRRLALRSPASLP
jgi:hypothetical protein